MEAYVNYSWIEEIQMKKSKLALLCSCLAGVLFCNSMSAFATDNTEKKVQVITGFEEIEDNCIVLDERGTGEELIMQMPEKIKVELDYEKVLKKEYPEQILGKYKDEVNKMAMHTSDRKHYAHLVSLLRKMQQMKGGVKLVEQIATEWKAKYKNRPAMMDELRKL